MDTLSLSQFDKGLQSLIRQRSSYFYRRHFSCLLSPTLLSLSLSRGNEFPELTSVSNHSKVANRVFLSLPAKHYTYLTGLTSPPVTSLWTITEWVHVSSSTFFVSFSVGTRLDKMFCGPDHEPYFIFM